jgi:L-ascorbate metabolism protein UlaG (beta-lactamase superfamily)
MRPLPVALAAVVLAGCSLLRTPAPAPQHAHPLTPTVVDPDTDSISVTWIGHATVLIRMKDRWFLTDPVFGDRIARVYPRKVRAGMDPLDLPPIDAVLISHSHFDHLDPPSLRRLAGTPVLVPPGSARHLPRGTRSVALDTWETWRDGDVTITAVPSSHASGRYLVDRWETHGHTGYVIEYGGLCVYFAGDTGFDGEQARAIHARFAIDVALIPVGPAGRGRVIEWLRRKVHATPAAAVRIFEAVGAQWMVPIHYGTFFATFGKELPVLRRAVAGNARVRVLGVGESTEFLY